jgi:hypothetical protein
MRWKSVDRWRGRRLWRKWVRRPRVMQTTKYTPQEEQALMSRLWSAKLRDDPEAFVMFVFPWGEKGTPLEKRSGPRKWQRDILRKIRAHIEENGDRDMYEVFRLAVASGRGSESRRW